MTLEKKNLQRTDPTQDKPHQSQFPVQLAIDLLDLKIDLEKLATGITRGDFNIQISSTSGSQGDNSSRPQDN